MLFNSYSFILFFTVVTVTYYLLANWQARKAVLLGASYLFYAAWNPPFVILLGISTVADWILARRIHKSVTRLSRRLYLVGSLSVNLGLLGYFKYGGFICENTILLLKQLGWTVNAQVPDIVLPVGISFYTFQTLSYSFDVYRGKLSPWHSFLDYALYVSFFPQLVAGPIVRAKDFLPQCDGEKQTTRCVHRSWGLNLLVLGLFEKMVLADGLLAPVVEKVYAADAALDTASAWLGTVAFAGQVFFDFAGYSLCAIGAAMCLGFCLQDNFRFPYGAVGFSDFWRRWHISLSSWLRDYLYIPLGGNARGIARTLANLMITMFLAGLWHGASWTFVAFGILHGLFLVVEHLLRKLVPARLAQPALLRFGLAILTFTCFTITLVLFRAESFAQAFAILNTMFGLQPSVEKGILDSAMKITSCSIVGILFLFHWLMRDKTLEQIAGRLPWPIHSILMTVMLLSIVTLSGDDRAFVYFQF